jgi:hypothetical protein
MSDVQDRFVENAEIEFAVAFDIGGEVFQSVADSQCRIVPP